MRPSRPGAGPPSYRCGSARGLSPGWGWMVFRRGAEDLPPADTTLRLAEAVTPQERATFARGVRISYDLPEAVEVWSANSPHGGWQCCLALARDEPVGAAALFA